MAVTPPPSSERAGFASAADRGGPSSPDGGRGGARLLVMLLCLLPVLAACATKSDIRDLGDEMQEVAARQEALIRELQEEQEILRDSIRVLSGQFGEHRIQMGRTLRGLEDHLVRVQELAGLSQQELAALRDQMDRRPLPTAPGRGGTPAGGGGEARVIYEDAMTQFRRGALTSARLGLEEVVAEFPNHELTPSARYYLADILVQEDQLEEAIAAFEEIVEYHPDADRVPNALYRIGLLHREMGDQDEARSYLERVVNTWPESDVADLARSALRDMG